MSIKEMAMKRKAERERVKSAFDAIDEEQDQEAEVESPQATQNSGFFGKLKSKVSDYAGKQFRKTSVEMPEEVLHAWTVYCSTNRIKKRDHFLEILTKDLNKKMKG